MWLGRRLREHLSNPPTNFDLRLMAMKAESLEVEADRYRQRSETYRKLLAAICADFTVPYSRTELIDDARRELKKAGG